MNICKNLRCQNPNAHVQIHFAVLNDNVVSEKGHADDDIFLINIFLDGREKGRDARRLLLPLLFRRLLPCHDDLDGHDDLIRHK